MDYCSEYTGEPHLETDKSRSGSRRFLFFVQTFDIYSEASHNLINASSHDFIFISTSTEIDLIANGYTVEHISNMLEYPQN